MATTARVLMIGAHPDDEETQTIAWLARGRSVETAYLSLTRGDGGQNLIGNELGEALGAIRTEELLAARRIDGGRQYFTRAYDFGFSKNADETAKHWPRDSILADAVTVVRAFRPHIIYSIWSGTRADGHGHHETSGLVAREVFAAAVDTLRFPVPRYGEPWAPLKLYMRGPGVALPVQEYDQVAGRTYAEIAAESRAQHRSQGFGDAQLNLELPVASGRGGGGRGTGFASLRRVMSRVSADSAAESSLFADIDTTFNRLVIAAPARVQDNLEGVAIKADSVRELLNLREPWRLAPLLARLASAVQQVRSFVPPCALRVRAAFSASRGVGAAPRCGREELDLDASLETLERRATQALLAATQLRVDAVAARELVAFGDSVPVTVTIVNRGRQAIGIADLRVTGSRALFDHTVLRPDSFVVTRHAVIGLPDARSWWMGGREGALFAPKVSPLDGIARVSATSMMMVPSVAVSEERRRITDVRLTLEIAGQSVVVSAGPVVFRTADPLLGVQERPLGGVPAVTLGFDRGLEWFPAGKPADRFLRLTIKSHTDQPRSFALRSVVPPGMSLDSLPANVTLRPREQREILLRVRGTLAEGRHEFGVVGTGQLTGTYAEGFSTISFPHIQPIHRYRSSGVYFAAVDINVPTRMNVAYIQGVGDDNAVFLRQLGVPITIVQPADVAQWDLSRFTSVVIGTRAFETNSGLDAYASRFAEYAQNGGTLVLQYGQTFSRLPQLFPFPLQWSQPAPRVTVEDSPVTVAVPRSRLLTTPNVVRESDWQGWTQERSLYMPSTIDQRYDAPIAINDPGEAPNTGGILSAPFGKGTFVFTSLALFRQLPAAVPGSARLLINMIAAQPGPLGRVVP